MDSVYHQRSGDTRGDQKWAKPKKVEPTLQQVCTETRMDDEEANECHPVVWHDALLPGKLCHELLASE